MGLQRRTGPHLGCCEARRQNDGPPDLPLKLGGPRECQPVEGARHDDELAHTGEAFGQLHIQRGLPIEWPRPSPHRCRPLLRLAGGHRAAMDHKKTQPTVQLGRVHRRPYRGPGLVACGPGLDLHGQEGAGGRVRTRNAQGWGAAVVGSIQLHAVAFDGDMQGGDAATHLRGVLPLAGHLGQRVATPRALWRHKQLHHGCITIGKIRRVDGNPDWLWRRVGPIHQVRSRDQFEPAASSDGLRGSWRPARLR
mmetsp:Transcript_15878/g.47176  ORF Transcript_15878/g.47176 Transcript_15878/m.47176 type:complete len:251 (+) Transcript_15878:192-944(+)